METEPSFHANAVAWAFQVHAVLDTLHRQDKTSTGFHRLAARKMAEAAWESFAASLGEVVEEQDRLLDDVEQRAATAERILVAYLKDRGNTPSA